MSNVLKLFGFKTSKYSYFMREKKIKDSNSMMIQMLELL